MALQPGQQILHYRVVEQIGEGGMGVVWKAVDTTLNREVAIKVLPPMVAQDPERLARFDREAKLLASLNHANIASVFGLHEAAGASTGSEPAVRFLSMEYVEGEDLAKRLDRGRLSLEEALGMARQIADALQSAHERGVVHRDLKPANILLTPEGKVKVLDFGLAKAFEPDPASPANPAMSPTLTSHGTVAGMILGTAGYMSPEQARGDVVDKRSDVWAFGVVLFEMLCGSRAFHGDTVSDTLASVLKLEPDWNLLPGDLPRGVQRLLRRCLHKDPRQRLHDIADARIEIDEALTAPRETAVADVAEAIASPRTRWTLTAVLAALALLAGLVIGRMLVPSAPESRVRRFLLPLETSEGQASLGDVRISPDGKTIAYVFADKLWLRDLDSVEPRPIDGTDGADAPFWSPDGSQVAYLADDKLWRVPVGGGQPTAISDVASNARLATWSTEQTISVSVGDGIQQLAARGGEAKTVHEADANTESDFHGLQGGRGHAGRLGRRLAQDDSPAGGCVARLSVLRVDRSHPVHPGAPQRGSLGLAVLAGRPRGDGRSLSRRARGVRGQRLRRRHAGLHRHLRTVGSGTRLAHGVRRGRGHDRAAAERHFRALGVARRHQDRRVRSGKRRVGHLGPRRRAAHQDAPDLRRRHRGRSRVVRRRRVDLLFPPGLRGTEDDLPRGRRRQRRARGDRRGPGADVLGRHEADGLRA
jgi:predicted Ser/Thr protein kinase